MLKTLKEELIKYGKIAGGKDYTPGISGNLSARYNDKIIITSSGSTSGYLTEGDLSIIDFNGNVIEGNPKPSSEKALHTEFYKQRPDIESIFHVHSPYLTAFASAGVSLSEPVSPEIVYCFGEIPLAEYALPGSAELVEKTSPFFKNYDVILMKNHGVIIGGKDIREAFLKLELTENYAKTIICAKILGGAKILSEEEVKKINSLKH